MRCREHQPRVYSPTGRKLIGCAGWGDVRRTVCRTKLPSAEPGQPKEAAEMHGGVRQGETECLSN